MIAVANRPTRSPRPSFFRFSAQEVCAIGACVLAVHLYRALRDYSPFQVDFAIFYETALRFRRGVSMYATDGALNINFNPPHFFALVYSFTYLPPRIAFLLWTACNAALTVAVVRTAMSALRDDWTRQQRWLIAACVLNAAATQATVRLGQISPLLALLVTLAWRAARSRREWSMGIWTGIAVSLKPFLLLLLPVFAIRQQWKATFATVCTATLMLAAAAAVFGFPALVEWLTVLRATPEPGYFEHFLNASAAGLALRSGLSPIVGTVAAIWIGASTIVSARRGTEDRAWALALIACLLCSPLGWTYYLLTLVGPLLGLADGRRLPSFAWWLAIPFAFLVVSATFATSPPILGATLGSIYFWGLFSLWALLLFDVGADRRRDSVPLERESRPAPAV